MRTMHRPGTMALWAIVGLCAGCVEHAGPEAMALLDAARAALEASNHAAAVERTSEFLAQNSHTAEAEAAYYVRGLARWQAGDQAGAREDLQAAASRARTGVMHFKAVKALGDLAMETGDAEWAVTLYKQAIEEAEPNAPALDEVRYGLGCAYQRLGQWWQADAQFDRLGHVFPDSPTAALAGRRVRCQAWTFQISAYRRKGLADDESARLGRLGLETNVRPAIVGDGLLYLVESGRHDTYAQALADAERVRRFSADAKIVPTR